MDKRLLLIINPHSGTKRANKYLTDIISVFNAGGWECTVYTTAGQGDGTRIVMDKFTECDLVVCIGGDGTFNEIIAGVMQCGKSLPIGYIPSGSTNDFANSLKLPKNILKAARTIANGSPQKYDTGLFGDRYFTYVASFGAFTKTSYSTPQNIKNALGHLAYILEGIKDLPSIHPEHLRIEANGEIYEDDYIFGAISNSTSVGGILTLDPKTVDMNDGLLEILLIRSPKNIVELNECIIALQTRNFSSKMITFFSTDQAIVHADSSMDWTLDGEYEQGHELVVVRNVHDAFQLIV